MTPINFHKKEKPLTSLVSMGGGAAGMANAGLEGKTYIEDVFKTDVWDGVSDAAQLVGTGIDYTKGGMVWNKKRTPSASNNVVIDTENGPNKAVFTNTNQSLNTITGGSEFTNNGFNWASENNFHGNSTTQVSWNFRKAPGFFDIVTWTGNGVDGRTIAHSLGSIPGCIMVKRTNNTSDWAVYHRSNGATKNFYLNSSGAAVTDQDVWNDTEPTSSVFTVGDHAMVNVSGGEYVAYVFAGGESTAATASSISYTSTIGRTYTTSSSTDFSFGTGDFTIECWARYRTQDNDGVFQISADSGGLSTGGTNTLATAYNGSFWHSYGANTTFNSPACKAASGSWQHVAMVRHNSVLRLYIDGVQVSSIADTVNYSCTYINIGGYYTTSFLLNGDISNFRVVKGTAVYTSAFRPPTEPLTNISGTVLLCNNDSTNNEGATVIPSGVTLTTSNGTASTDSPFDDLDGYKFGEEGDQNIIKTNSYIGNGTNPGPPIYLGWEPQYVLVKSATTSGDWRLFDSMRGIVTGGNDPFLGPNQSDVEHDSSDYFHLTSRGFQMTNSYQNFNSSGEKYVYICIRMSDGYVGKPAEAGTDSLAIDVGNTTVPYFESGFPVDFGFTKKPAASSDWYAATRLMGDKRLELNTDGAEGAASTWWGWDQDTAWGATNWNSYNGWMWRRGAGLDVVTYTGDGVAGRGLPHSLNKAPEMVWVKLRDRSSHSWVVGHKGLDGGSNPWGEFLYLNTSDAESNQTWPFNDTAPTASHLILGNGGMVNGDGDPFITILFASVTGISKCGYYTGNGQTLSNGKYITTGFQPRFIVVKHTGSGNWYTFDSVRGWGTPGQNTTNLYFNGSNTENGSTLVEPDATGFRVVDDSPQVNGNGNPYIYYAHA